jgi:hypothetical protein
MTQNVDMARSRRGRNAFARYYHDPRMTQNVDMPLRGADILRQS